MKNLSKFKWALLIIVLHLIALLYFALTLSPDAHVPMHWNVKNQIDGWEGKTFGLLWGAGMNLFLFLLLFLLPWYSPWYRKYQERNDNVIPSLTTMLVFFFSLISIYSLAIAKWIPFERWNSWSGTNIILILMGLLFIFLGNLLPKVPKNFFVGIKTPWTIANEEVWDKTHRLGGLLFVLAGLLMILKGIILPQNPTFQTVTAVIAFGMMLYPVLHSFILYIKRDRSAE